MRIIFMGTPEFAVPALIALVEAGHEVIAAYSQPPRPAGRGKQLQPSPVQREAEARGIPVRHPVSLKGADEQAAFAALDADIAVVAAYGLILPRAVLDAPKHGCLNIHASLLPRWRGAAPIQRAILAGDAETGVCIMRMEAGLDTGPVLHCAKTPVDQKSTGVLTTELAQMGGRLMVEVLADLAAYPAKPQPVDGITYASKIAKSESRLDFTQGAQHVERQVRAFAPAPGAFFEFAGERIKVLEARIETESPQNHGTHFTTTPGEVLDTQLAIGCGIGAIHPRTVQRAGRPAMDAADLLRGFPIPKGTHLA
ncbi:MAG: methionyl-tRNA formyltransferase [Novosphingobium sp.]|nr:methionyl-tRNA formyltransferase [Novosphingobium sp.]